MQNIDIILATLRLLHIEKLTLKLSGANGNGIIGVKEIVWCPDVKTKVGLEEVKSPYYSSSFSEFLLDWAGEWPETDWVNDDGGVGVIIVRPFLPPDESVEINIVSRNQDHESYLDAENSGVISENLGGPIPGAGHPGHENHDDAKSPDPTPNWPSVAR